MKKIIVFLFIVSVSVAWGQEPNLPFSTDKWRNGLYVDIRTSQIDSLGIDNKNFIPIIIVINDTIRRQFTTEEFTRLIYFSDTLKYPRFDYSALDTLMSWWKDYAKECWDDSCWRWFDGNEIHCDKLQSPYFNPITDRWTHNHVPNFSEFMNYYEKRRKQ